MHLWLNTVNGFSESPAVLTQHQFYMQILFQWYLVYFNHHFCEKSPVFIVLAVKINLVMRSQPIQKQVRNQGKRFQWTQVHLKVLKQTTYRLLTHNLDYSIIEVLIQKCKLCTKTFFFPLNLSSWACKASTGSTDLTKPAFTQQCGRALKKAFLFSWGPSIHSKTGILLNCYSPSHP